MYVFELFLLIILSPTVLCQAHQLGAWILNVRHDTQSLMYICNQSSNKRISRMPHYDVIAVGPGVLNIRRTHFNTLGPELNVRSFAEDILRMPLLEGIFLAINQHWFVQWRQGFTCTNDDLDYWQIYDNYQANSTEMSHIHLFYWKSPAAQIETTICVAGSQVDRLL